MEEVPCRRARHSISHFPEKKKKNLCNLSLDARTLYLTSGMVLRGPLQRCFQGCTKKQKGSCLQQPHPHGHHHIEAVG